MALMFKGPAALTGASTINTTGVADFTSGTVTIATAAVTGGTINSTSIGGTTASSGAFTTLSADSIDSTPIGATTASSGAFTDLSASGTVTVGGNAFTSVATSTAGDDTALPTKGYVDEAVASGGTLATITLNNDGDTYDLANGRVYLLLTDGPNATAVTVTGTNLTDGGIVRFVAVDATNTFTFTLTKGADLTSFKLVDGTANTNIVFNTSGHGLDFVFYGGVLYKLGGGFASSS
jgi:hypothetical protein